MQPNIKKTKHLLIGTTKKLYHSEITTSELSLTTQKNVFVNRLIFKYNLWCFYYFIQYVMYFYLRKNKEWLIDWLIDWLSDWLSDWLTDWLSDWLIDWLSDWLIDWVIDWLIDWLIDWVIDWSQDLKNQSEKNFLVS